MNDLSRLLGDLSFTWMYYSDLGGGVAGRIVWVLPASVIDLLFKTVYILVCFSCGHVTSHSHCELLSIQSSVQLKRRIY